MSGPHQAEKAASNREKDAQLCTLPDLPECGVALFCQLVIFVLMSLVGLCFLCHII